MGSIKSRTESIKDKRAVPLSLFYLKYFGFLFFGILAVVCGAFLVFQLLVLNGVVYPANYAEQQAKGAADRIAAAQEVHQEMIPDLCRYVIFDADGEVLDGDMEKAGIEGAWNAVQGKRSDAKGHYYLVIPRGTEYCVLQYMITPQYSSYVLRRYLPQPQNWLLATGLCLILLLVVITALWFGYTLRKKLAPLAAAAGKIRNQELEFDILPSDIREISAVLKAMDDMRAALKTSLESQWELEQRKKEQLLALAHDLKTPLTLIRGNAELLCDTELTEGQRECAESIESSSLRMQEYVQSLMEVTKNGYALQPQKIETEPFLQEIGEQIRRLCVMKRISLQENFACGLSSFMGDRGLLMRAILNIASNAAEYTPEGGTIFWEAESVRAGADDSNTLVFSVTDTGKGFSAEALKHAAEQFYMEDRSRHSKSHYGIGLFMADLAAKQHGGRLFLENSPETGGARVIMKIPC